MSEFLDNWWERLAEEYAAQTPESPVVHIRAHGDTGKVGLYTWSPGSTGAFGGRRYVVTLDDGRVLGPASSLWHRGFIPDDMLDRFPPNARITADGFDSARG